MRNRNMIRSVALAGCFTIAASCLIGGNVWNEQPFSHASAAETATDDAEQQKTDDAEQQKTDDAEQQKMDDAEQQKMDWLKAIVEGIFGSPVKEMTAEKTPISLQDETITPYRVTFEDDQTCLVATRADGSACVSENLDEPAFRAVVIGEKVTYLGKYIDQAYDESACEALAAQVAKDLKLADDVAIKKHKGAIVANRQTVIYSAYAQSDADALIGSIAVDLGLTHCYYKKAGGKGFSKLTHEDGTYQLPKTTNTATPTATPTPASTATAPAASPAPVPKLTAAEEKAQRNWLIALVEGLFKTKVKKIDLAPFDIDLYEQALTPLNFQCHNGKEYLVALHPSRGVFISEGTTVLAFHFVKIENGVISLDEEIAKCQRTDQAYVDKANELIGALNLGRDTVLKKYGFDVVEARKVAVYMLHAKDDESERVGYMAIDASLKHCYFKTSADAKYSIITQVGGGYSLGKQVS